MTRRVVAVAVVAFVVLAGCTGGSTDGESTDLPEVTEQSWVAANGSVDYEQLLKRHDNVMANASSYEFRQHHDSNTDSTTVTSIAVNRERERALLSISADVDGTERVQETFVMNDTVYSKSGSADDPEYTSQEENVTGEDFDRFVGQQTQLPMTGDVLDAFEFEYVGVEDGAYVFEADSVRPSDETSFDAENATAASGRLVVAEAGYVRELTLSLTVDGADGEQSTDLTVETVGVNETTVSEPPWVEKAD